MALFNIFKKKQPSEKLIKLFRYFYKPPIFKNRIDYFYKHPEWLTDIEFANRTDQKKVVWVEPTCVEFDIDAHTEYRIVTHDKFFRIEFDSNDSIIFYLQYSFGFKLYKRPVSEEIPNPNSWILDDDTSEIN
jgi:hypothetical protein